MTRSPITEVAHASMFVL